MATQDIYKLPLSFFAFSDDDMWDEDEDEDEDEDFDEGGEDW
jgi:hypothetical protein